MGLHAEKCIEAVYTDGAAKGPVHDEDVETDVKKLAELSVCRSSEGRKAAKRSLQYIYKQKGVRDTLLLDIVLLAC